MKAPLSSRERTPPSVIAALTLACVFFVPLVPLVGVGLGVRGVLRLRRGQAGRSIARAAIVVGLALSVLHGVTAAIVVPRALGFWRRSRAAEGPMALGRVQTQLEALGASALARGHVDWTPARRCCAQRGQRCRNSRADWGAAIWRVLDFRAYGERHEFQYRYRSDGVQAVFEARADLDCDGVYSSYQLRVRRERGALRFVRRAVRPYE